VDEEVIITATRQLLTEHDSISAECLEYTHLAKQHHVTTDADTVEIVNNGSTIPEIVQLVEISVPTQGCVEEVTTLVAYGPITEMEAVLLEADNLLQQHLVLETESALVYGPLTLVETLQEKVAKLSQQDVGHATQIPEVILEDAEVPSRNFTICQDVIEVKDHRRVHKHMQEAYVYSVVTVIKNRLGVPKNNAANLLAVRRMANQIMVKHGVRPTEIRRSIELVIAGVFIPDNYDILGAKIRASNIVADRVEEYEHASPKTYWQRLWKSFSRGANREEKG